MPESFPDALLHPHAVARCQRAAANAMPLSSATDPVLSTSGILRVLICRPIDTLGNNLLLTPLLQEIESVWPDAQVDIVTRSAAAAEIFAAYSNVRDIYRLPRRSGRHPLKLLRELYGVRRNSYDLAIDPDLRSRSGRTLVQLSRARHKLGFTGAQKSAAIGHRIDATQAPTHAGKFPVYLLSNALQRRAADYPPLDLHLSPDEREEGKQILARLLAEQNCDEQNGKRKHGVIGIFANATPPKFRDAVWWREFMPAIESHFVDFSIIELLPASAVSAFDSRYPTFYASDVRKLAKVLSQLSMLICLDCGVMHLARASGTPTAAIFNLTAMIDEWQPYGDGAFVIDGQGLAAGAVAQRLIEAVPASKLRSAE